LLVSNATCTATVWLPEVIQALMSCLTTGNAKVGGCITLIQLTHSSKGPGFNPCTYKVINWFQSFLSNAQLVLLHLGAVERVPRDGRAVPQPHHQGGGQLVVRALYKLNPVDPKESAWFY
jgi:hypothetical protein